MLLNQYDVIVVGAGHAGCEAAAAAANMGSKTLLITMNLLTLAQMSCNPAMGGIGKGQIVREIDALGGYSGIVSDKSMIQFRMLNKSKGPAMWSPRCQSDRLMFATTWREMLELTPNLFFFQDSVVGLIVSRGTIEGVITAMGHKIYSKAVILTNGTFLNGIIHIGEKQFGGGRMGEKGATGITEDLIALGFESDRLKTGTPPRVDGRTLDYTKMELQEGDPIDEITGFSYLPNTLPDFSKSSYVDNAQLGNRIYGKQRPCWITYTSEEVHEILKTGFDKSPMYQGRIQGSGPRYCPSIEDKINRFADKDRHQLFVEPEGWNTVEIYVNGFSTSLPENVQMEAIRKVPGFEQALFYRPGYAIEYDYFPPTQLQFTLETKLIKNLFFAGQINGTTGYEEAAGQGIIAGINAHNNVHGMSPFILKRDEAYIGVLIDDLINKGTEEPYRMFTSRAEFRTLLRQDNADMRLTQKSYDIGLAKKERIELLAAKKKNIEEVERILATVTVEPQEINHLLENIGSASLKERQKVAKILLRPNLSIKNLCSSLPSLDAMLAPYNDTILEQAEIKCKYQVYIDKEVEMAKRIHTMEDLLIPENFNYDKLTALSIEARQKLNKIRPHTLGQASRISGVNPSDIQILMIYMGR
jgi:tRNA uridine 5-carboxymethylaminomethyl modification enzyme